MSELNEANDTQHERYGRPVSGAVLPEDPDVEELARDWTLTEADIGEVLLCRGMDNCLRFALQLCVLRLFGRFLEEYDDPPVRIVNHFAAQLHLPPVLLLAPPRPATEGEYRERLRRAMSHSTDGITLEMLRHVSQWCLRPETLKAANRVLVDFHHRLPISAVWGTGIRSSSDGQRFAVQQDSKIGAYYPRYFGYYGNALTLYTHVTDQFGVYSTQPVSCIIRESLYVLAGLLGNDTVVRP